LSGRPLTTLLADEFPSPYIFYSFLLPSRFSLPYSPEIPLGCTATMGACCQTLPPFQSPFGHLLGHPSEALTNVLDDIPTLSCPKWINTTPERILQGEDTVSTREKKSSRSIQPTHLELSARQEPLAAPECTGFCRASLSFPMLANVPIHTQHVTHSYSSIENDPAHLEEEGQEPEMLPRPYMQMYKCIDQSIDRYCNNCVICFSRLYTKLR